MKDQEIVSVPRELLEQYLGIKKGDWVEVGHELRDILAQPVADERDLFEVRGGVSGEHLYRTTDGEYGNPYVQTAWDGWKLRASLCAAPIAQAVAQHVMEENEKLRGLLREAVHCCPDEQLRNEMKAALSVQGDDT